MCVLIRPIICESFVKKQLFKHEWLSIMCENSWKSQQNQGVFHKLQSHLVRWHIKMCILIIQIICGTLMKIYTWKKVKKSKKNSLFCSKIKPTNHFWPPNLNHSLSKEDKQNNCPHCSFSPILIPIDERLN